MHRGSPRRASEDDPIQLLQRLRHRSWRDRRGLYFAEGVRSLVLAAQRPDSIVRLIVSWKLLQAVPGRQLVRRLRRNGTPCTLVTPETFRSVSRAPRASGVALAMRQRWRQLDDVDPHVGTAWLLLREVHSPGNLGTLLRTLAGTDGGGVILLGDQPDPYDPAVVRAAMGAVLGCQLVRTTAAALQRFKSGAGCTVIGTSPAAAVDYGDVDWRSGALIFLGGERKGLDEADAALCDLTVRIPMSARIDSLNLGVAGSLMMYEAYRSRLAERNASQR